MSAQEPAREQSEGGLTVCLWVVAVLLGVLELTWWMAQRMYAS